MSALDHILGPRPRMTLVVENARIVEIWVEGRAPLIAVRDYDWGVTDPEARRDEDGVSFSDINWRGPAWALGLSLHPPVRPSHPLGGCSSSGILRQKAA